MWKAERMGQMGRKHNTDTDATKGDREGQNSRVEGQRTDGNGRRRTENVQEQILRNISTSPVISVRPDNIVQCLQDIKVR